MPRFYTFRALFLAGALGAIAGAFAAAASLSVLDVTPIGSTCRSLLAMQQWQAREDAQGRENLDAVIRANCASLAALESTCRSYRAV
jgi:hypothetical protein